MATKTILKKQVIPKIRKSYELGMSVNEISKRFKVSSTTIYKAVAGLTDRSRVRPETLVVDEEYLGRMG